MVYDKNGNFSGNVDDLVETFARMNLEQRQDFVETMTRKWPHMAESIGNMISLQVLINKQVKEAI